MPKLTARQQKRNFKLGVVNGALFRVADSFIDIQMVFTWFLLELGVSNVLISLVSPIRMGSSFVLQILAAGYMQRMKYKKPMYIWVSIFRCGILLLYAIVTAFMPLDSPWLTVVFFAIFVIYSLGVGLVGLPFMDMTAKAVPMRMRGAFFSQRMFWGGLLALGSSAIVSFLLKEPWGLVFPRNASILFGLAFVFFVATAISWVMTDEPPSIVKHEQVKWSTQFMRGLRILRDNADYRKYAIVRAGLIIGAWATPFYLVYAREELGIGAELVGFYLAARTVASIASNLLWGNIHRRRGSARVVLVNTLVGLAAPLTALLIGAVHNTLPGNPVWINYTFALVFILSGAYATGGGAGLGSYQLDLAPEDERPLYLAFSNTIFGALQFTAPIGGLIVDGAGFGVVMVVSAVFYAASAIASTKLTDFHKI